jgi:hypothetical protein
MKDEASIERMLDMLNKLIEHKKADLDHNRFTHDWHGCEDSASDIRDLVALRRGLLWVLDSEILWGE